jgi:hypothetical protein
MASLRRRRNNADGTTGTEEVADIGQQDQDQDQDQEEEEHEEENNSNRAALFETLTNTRDGDASLELEDIDRSMRRASLMTLASWMVLVAFAYGSVPRDSWQRLEGAERISALCAFVALTLSLVARIGPLVLEQVAPILIGGASINHFSSRRLYFSGILIGGITTQLVAIATDAMMAFGRVPVLVDPVLQTRVSVLRWAEFATTAFLMTFLTEAFGFRHKHRKALSVPMLHAICQGLATFCGLFFPYCPGKVSWYTLLVIACCLFSVIFYRLRQKENLFQKMSVGRTLNEAISYDRARLSLRMLRECTICWTLFPIVFFTSGFILPSLAPASSPFRDPAIPMIFEALLDVLSKLLQMNSIIAVHTGVWDDPDGVRALQRLEEVKDALGETWATSNDIVILSVRQQFSGTVTSMVSPPSSSSSSSPTHTTPGDGGNNEQQPDQTPLVFSLGWEHFSGNTIRPTDHSVRPSIVSGGDGGGFATTNNNNNMPHSSALAGLVVRAWDAKELMDQTTQTTTPRTLFHDLKTTRCHVEIRLLEDDLLVVVVRL